jgi:uncharacterized protein with HEPN domain
MSDRLPKHLHDVLQAARLALSFLGARGPAGYEADVLLRSAVERQVEIVGEACRRSLDDTPELRSRMPEAVLAIAMRNRISQGYDGIDNAFVLNTVNVHFPLLILKLELELAPFSRG